MSNGIYCPFQLATTHAEVRPLDLHATTHAEMRPLDLHAITIFDSTRIQDRGWQQWRESETEHFQESIAQNQKEVELEVSLLRSYSWPRWGEW